GPVRPPPSRARRNLRSSLGIDQNSRSARNRRASGRNLPCPPILRQHGEIVKHLWQLLRRGYATVVGGIIIVTVWATDRGSSAVVARGVISTRGSSSANRSST